MSDDVRTIAAEEIGPWVDQMGVGFHFQIAEGLADYLLGVVEIDRTWAAFDGARVVGTLRSFETPLTVPGPAEVPAAALTNVTVAPTHRRQGRLSAMISADLRQSAERGEPVGILIASEYPIYGRFGYGPAVDGARYAVSTRGISFRRRHEGTVALVDAANLRSEAPAIYERYRAAQPGAIGRREGWWDRSLRVVSVAGDEPLKESLAIYRSPAGEAEGYVRYEGKLNWDDMQPAGTLSLKELVATTDEAYAALWEYCSGVDLLTTIEAGDRPADERLDLFLADGRAVKQTGRWDFVWVRVLDPAAALAARTYTTSGSLVLEVVDELGIASGRFALEAGPEGAACTPSTAAADLTMPVDTLGSVYLGGVAFSSLHRAGRVDEHRPGAVARAESMFRTPREPWCNTWF